MPGIFGIISNKSEEDNLNKLKIMANTLYTDEKYSTGTYLLKNDGIYVGWTCHKNSFSDCLPIVNEDKKLILIFIGECYHESEQLDELKKRNHCYNKKNASYLIHMYEEYKENFFAMLNGHFQGLIIDKTQGTAILFSDRYGTNKIYYHESQNAFYFSYEYKNIIKVLPKNPNMHSDSLAEFFTFGCVLEYRSLIDNIYKLPPGSNWVFFNDGTIKKNSYFTINSLENQPILESEFHYQKFQHTFKRVLKKYFRAEEKIGIFLEEGTGTRIILSNAMYGYNNVQCFFFGRDEKSVDSLKIAKKIASLANINLNIITLENCFFNNINEFAEKSIYISEGNCSITNAIMLYMYEKVREITPICIYAKHYAAILRGENYIRIKNICIDLFEKEFAEKINNVKENYLNRSFSPVKIANSVALSLPYLSANEICLLQAKINIRTPFLDNDIVDLMFRALNEVLDNNLFLIKLIRDGNPSFLTKIEIMKLYLSKISDSIAQIERLEKNWHYILEIVKLKVFQKNDEYMKCLAKYAHDILSERASLDRDYLNKKAIKKILNKNDSHYYKDLYSLATVEILNRIISS
jgi:asparagine synthase (glutamine-hydrolysing)